MLLTEAAGDGLTQAGALLWRIEPSLAEHVLWVNPEVPTELAPTLQRDRRMYAVAVKESEQRQVMVLHPWLDEIKHTSYESYLTDLEAYGLSHVMDKWRSLKRPSVNYFVIENNPGVPAEPGGVWMDFFRAGHLVWIRRRGDSYILEHPETGQEDLERVFGVSGKTFWMDKWLTRYWEKRDRILRWGWKLQAKKIRAYKAAFLAQVPSRSALSAIQQLCGIVHHPTFLSRGRL